jgi:hypothetical protein
VELGIEEVQIGGWKSHILEAPRRRKPGISRSPEITPDPLENIRRRSWSLGYTRFGIGEGVAREILALPLACRERAVGCEKWTCETG